MTPVFQKATRRQAKARVAIDGPAGSGKTYTALIAAKSLANGSKIAVIDTERGSASLYADEFDFDVLELDNFNPRNYIEAIRAAEQAGYSVIVIDSMSHAWEGEGGILDMHDAATKRQRTENSYTAWKDVTPVHREFVDAMLQSPAHIIATMRAKMEYSQEKDGNGKTVIRKIGLAPVQRAGTEYEFTVVCDMDVEHTLTVSKSRCKPLADKVARMPGGAFFDALRDWLNSGEAPVPPQPKQEPVIDPEEIYNEAARRIVKSNGKEIAIGDMTKEQLDWLLANGKDQKNVDAAAIVMQHDYSMILEHEDEFAEIGNTGGQTFK